MGRKESTLFPSKIRGSIPAILVSKGGGGGSAGGDWKIVTLNRRRKKVKHYCRQERKWPWMVMNLGMV